MTGTKIDWSKVEQPDFVYQQFTSRRSTVYGKKGVVSCTEPLACEVGLEVLRKGGNAGTYLSHHCQHFLALSMMGTEVIWFS